ncbi:MAG: zf-HC2 domain-containing protein [Actinobacteria bacterium]|nr:zf-HC2 domain-containing protein [Actinomycetota bacterium]
MRWSRWWRRRPLTCPEVARLLQRHLDEELPQHLAVRVEAHLEDCRRCGLEAEAYEQIKQAVHRQGQTVPPESVERLRAFAASLLEQRDDDADGPR